MIAAVAALLGAIVAPAVAAAQPGTPTLSVSSHALTDEASFVASVALDVAGADVGALSAVLDYDGAALQFIACTPSDGAVCNEMDGQVRFAGFDVDGFVSNDRFVDIEFGVLDRSAPVDLELTITTLVDVLGTEGEQLTAASGTVNFVAPAVPVGGINGEVLDGAGVGVFGAQVCTVFATAEQVCTATTGLGAFALNDVAVGTHSLVVSDPNDVLPTTTQLVDVAEGRVTTGVSVVLVAGEPDVEPQTLEVPAPDADPAISTPDAPTAEAGQIVIQIAAADGGFAIFGAEVCATMPVIGTQACGFSDAGGLVALSDLGVGNYELTAADPAGRFDPAASIFVGLNPDEGVNAVLELPGRGLGEIPEVLAFVDPSPQSETVGVTLSAAALAAMTFLGIARRRDAKDAVASKGHLLLDCARGRDAC
jgi:hypothetical protein